MSPDEVVQAINNGNVLQPAGNVRTGSLLRIAQSDSVTPNIQTLADLPIRTGSGPTVYLHDIGSVQDSTDIPTGYALVNGRRAVYIPVTKRPDASTVTVVKEVKKSLPYFQSLVPDDIKVSYELDQSPYVTSALTAVVREGLLGAVLTGLVVLLFLGDWRSSFIVMTTIPFALLTSVVALMADRPDHQHHDARRAGAGRRHPGGRRRGRNRKHRQHAAAGTRLCSPRAACFTRRRGPCWPRFLSMLSVVAVFVPSFLMTGVAQNLFVPLSLAVAFAMIASFLLSSSLLPVLIPVDASPDRSRAARLLIAGRWDFDKVRDRWGAFLERLGAIRWLVVGGYAAVVLAIVLLLGPRLGQELFPNVGATQFRLRFDAPVGTRAEETERLVTGVLDEIRKAAGPENVAITLGYVGTQGASYPINTVFLWTSGPHEAVMNVALRPEAQST